MPLQRRCPTFASTSLSTRRLPVHPTRLRRRRSELPRPGPNRQRAGPPPDRPRCRPKRSSPSPSRVAPIWWQPSSASGKPVPLTCPWTRTIPETRRQQILADADPILVLDSSRQVPSTTRDSPGNHATIPTASPTPLHFWLDGRTKSRPDSNTDGVVNFLCWFTEAFPEPLPWITRLAFDASLKQVFASIDHRPPGVDPTGRSSRGSNRAGA